jgi:hypothetical protein
LLAVFQTAISGKAQDHAYGVAIEEKPDTCDQNHNPLKTLSIDGVVDLASAYIAVLSDKAVSETMCFSDSHDGMDIYLFMVKISSSIGFVQSATPSAHLKVKNA